MISRWRARMACSNERGASAVEFAIIAPLFFMVTFGMFTGGLAFNQRNQLTHAAREGARYGAILPINDSTIPTGTAWANNVIQTTRSRAFGDLDAAVPGNRICVALVEGTSPTTVVSVSGKGVFWNDTAGGAPGPCFADGGADGARRVQVRVFRNSFINAIIFRMNLTLSSQATARFEGK